MATCWLVDRRQSRRGQTAPATSTEASVDQGCEGPTPQPDRHASQSGSSATPSASHTGSHASQGLSSMQHPARLPVSRPAWMTYRVGLAMARRGHLTLAPSRPSHLAGFLTCQKALVVEIYNGTGHFRIPTTTARSAC